MNDETINAFWSDRYRQALAPGEIRRRATVRGQPVPGLEELEIEVACRWIELNLTRIFLLTVQAEMIIRTLIERALAHALLLYKSPTAVLSNGYSGDIPHPPEWPTLITGLAGVGKSKILEAMIRVLCGGAKTHIFLDEQHPRVEVINFVALRVGSQRTPKGVLLELAKPERLRSLDVDHPEQKARWNETDLIRECARKFHLQGTCGFSIDELQFLTQSVSASTFVSRLLLGLCEVRVPWSLSCNFSLLRKLLARPSELQQRLLANPVVLVPDLPSSADWIALLDEYNVVLESALEFQLSEKSACLWALTAGIKRKLVALLVAAYRIARRQGRSKICWLDVIHAYKSDWFTASRKDVEALISHAAQGGRIRKDLECPLPTSALGEHLQGYESQLREARQAILAAEVIHDSMVDKEAEAFAIIEQRARASAGVEPETAAKKAPRRRRTLESLQSAGRQVRDVVQAKNHRPKRSSNNGRPADVE